MTTLDKLTATGRIQEFVDGKLVFNTQQRIDGARLASYDAQTKCLVIRLDHSECLGFWAEVVLPMDQVMAFNSQHE